MGRAGVPLAGRSSEPEYDRGLAWSVLLLLATGLVMVYSASIALPDSPRFANYASTHFLVRHAVSIVLGAALGTVAFAVPVRHWQRWAGPLFLFGLVLLVLVLIPGVGKVVYGARRWLSLYVLNLQPSELMKLFVVLYAADYTVRKQDFMQSVRKGFAPMGTAVALVGVLLLLEPDMGAFVVIAAIAMGLLFLGGVNGKLFSFLVLIAGGVSAQTVVKIGHVAPLTGNNAALGRDNELGAKLVMLGVNDDYTFHRAFTETVVPPIRTSSESSFTVKAFPFASSKCMRRIAESSASTADLDAPPSQAPMPSRRDSAVTLAPPQLTPKLSEAHAPLLWL